MRHRTHVPSTRRRMVSAATLASTLLAVAALAAEVTCISMGTEGEPADGDSRHFGVSRNGRFWSYSSFAENLVEGDANGFRDVFVFDRRKGRTALVSVAGDGAQGDGDSHNGRMSANGRFVVFQSVAGNLVPGDTNGVQDVFVHDRRKGTTTRVSVADDGTQADQGCAWPSISSNGRFISYRSAATTLAPGDTNGVGDVFVHDRKKGTTTRAAFRSDGSEVTVGVMRHAISPRGRFVAFVTAEDGVVPDDANGLIDVFLHDRRRGTTERISIAHDGGEIDAGCFQPAFPLNDRYVEFPSEATNLVPDDTNGVQDVFLYDRRKRKIERLTVAPDGTEPNDWSNAVAFARGKRLLFFRSAATNLVPDDTNGRTDVFLVDRRTGTLERVSLNADGEEPDGECVRPMTCRSGRFLAIYSSATNLVPGDTNGVNDVFVLDLRR